MTVSTEISKTSYAGNGVTTAFATPIFLANTDIKVYLLDTTTNIQTDWTLGSEYTLTGAGTGLAGTLTTTLGNTLSSDEEIYILRSTPLTQGTDYVEADSFPARSHEAALDKLTFIAQEEKDALSRCVMVKETSNASLFKLSPEANTIIGFNDDATEFLNYSSLNLIPNSEASKYIKRNSANTAWEHLTPAEVLSDIGGINDTGLVKTTGDQTIGGVKTFSSSPIVPTPTTDYQAATKVYVDSVAGSGGFIGTCSTSAATADKTVAITGFSLTTGVKVLITFTNANTADTPTLNVESTGAKAIYNEAGVAVSATSPAYFPAGATIEFYYNGINWVYVNKVVDNYVNGATFYNQYANGWIEQGGITNFSEYDGITTFLKPFNNSNYTITVGLGQRIDMGIYGSEVSAWDRTNTGFTTRSTDHLWFAIGY